MSRRDGVGFEGVGALHDGGRENTKLESERALNAERFFLFAEKVLTSTSTWQGGGRGRVGRHVLPLTPDRIAVLETENICFHA